MPEKSARRSALTVISSWVGATGAVGGTGAGSSMSGKSCSMMELEGASEPDLADLAYPVAEGCQVRVGTHDASQASPGRAAWKVEEPRGRRFIHRDRHESPAEGGALAGQDEDSSSLSARDRASRRRVPLSRARKCARGMEGAIQVRRVEENPTEDPRRLRSSGEARGDAGLDAALAHPEIPGPVGRAGVVVSARERWPGSEVGGVEETCSYSVNSCCGRTWLLTTQS
jgi:hypothetical protein